MSETCTTCTTPLGTRDRACPICGTAVASLPPRPPAATTRRAILLDTAPPTPAPSAPRPSPARMAGPRRPGPKARRSHAGPTCAGTVTEVAEPVEITALTGQQHLRAVAACALAVAATLLLLVFGGAHRGQGLLLLLPTLTVVLALAAAPLLIPSARARTPLTRFRLTAVSGAHTACELLGEPPSAPPRTGDMLEIFGRGAPVVRVDEIVRDGQRLRGKVPITFAFARHAATGALVLSGVCALLACVLVVTG